MDDNTRLVARRGRFNARVSLCWRASSTRCTIIIGTDRQNRATIRSDYLHNRHSLSLFLSLTRIHTATHTIPLPVPGSATISFLINCKMICYVKVKRIRCPARGIREPSSSILFLRVGGHGSILTNEPLGSCHSFSGGRSFGNEAISEGRSPEGDREAGITCPSFPYFRFPLASIFPVLLLRGSGTNEMRDKTSRWPRLSPNSQM